MIINGFFISLFERLSNWFDPLIRWFFGIWRRGPGKFIILFSFFLGLLRASIALYQKVYNEVIDKLDTFSSSDVDFSFLSSASSYLGYVNTIFPVQELIYYMIMLLNLYILCIFIKLNLKIKRIIF
ncbi:MAG: hypothetical protein P9L97_01465 [Candidatus Tenebribacter davisii]|nr:hypothetical protein [Candidatus Tenebribacter davisii]